jgi:hypothetical protein
MPIALGGVFSIAVLALWAFCLLEVITTDERQMRYLPKMLWVSIVLLPIVGSVVWLLAGRPQGGRATAWPAAEPTGPMTPPDDDPEFLAQLGQVNAEHEQMLRQWEADLRRREEELRRDDDPDTPTA